jgi:D-ribulokinase
MTEAYIGVDVGTLSARAGIFDSTGKLIASARRAIAIWREPGEIVEQSSDDIWRAVTSAVHEAVEASGLPSSAVGGMGFDATSSLVALDRNGRPLSVSPTDAPERDVIVWMDHRAVDDAERINANGHETLRFVGGKISPRSGISSISPISFRFAPPDRSSDRLARRPASSAIWRMRRAGRTSSSTA